MKSKKVYQRIVQYKTVMSVLKNLLRDNQITASEYKQMCDIIAKKYGISSCSIFR